MARKITIAGSIATPEPLFVVSDNLGTAGETPPIQHVYAPTTSTQRTALAALDVAAVPFVRPPIGSTTNDVTTGKLYVMGAAAWELVTSA